MSVWYAFGCGHLAVSTLHQPTLPSLLESDFSPLWRLSLLKPTWWSAEKGTFGGVFIGLIAAFKFPWLRAGIIRGKKER